MSSATTVRILCIGLVAAPPALRAQEMEPGSKVVTLTLGEARNSRGATRIDPVEALRHE